MKEQQAVLQFIDQVRWLYEPEFGDFKRKLGLYLERLEENLPESSQSVVSNMRTAVVFNPNGDIESTRRQVIEMATQLLGSHGGPLH